MFQRKQRLVTLLAVGAMLLSACSPQTVKETVVVTRMVTQEVRVAQIVKETVIVGTPVTVVVTREVAVPAEEAVYYYREDHTGCKDGSRECPYNTFDEALAVGELEICKGRTFEIHKWVSEPAPGEYEWEASVPGKRPLPVGGLPLAQPVQVVLLALVGVLLVFVALRLRSRQAG